MGDNTSAASMSASTDTLSRDDFVDLFVEVVNICQPEHPTYGRDIYPVTRQDIELSYCRADSRTWARCGPRTGTYKIFYAFDKSYFQNVRFERVLAITVHELTHITIGTQNGRRAPMHPPAFWNEMAYHAQVVLDHLDDIGATWGQISPEVFRQQIITDPNSYMVDARSESLDDVHDRMQKWVGSYPANKLTK